MEKQVTVPPADEAYIRANYLRQSVPEMAKHLKRANVTVYGYMSALELDPKARQYRQGHPFRRKNKSLETMFLGRRIQNTQKTQ